MTNQERALWVAIKRLQRRTTTAGGGTPPSVHSPNHSSGSTDPIDVTDLDGFPGGSPVTYLDSDGQFTTPSAPGGVGNSTFTAAYASRPSAGNDGDLFLPSNGFVLERDTGSAWAPWGPIFPCTAPVNGDFAWINQGDASVATTNGGIFFAAPANASVNVRIRKKAAPATPYTITTMMLPRLFSVAVSAGLVFRQSSDGKLHTFGVAFGTSWLLASQKYTDANNFSANYTTVAADLRSPLFLRIADNGTDRICSWSTDGQNFVTIHTVGRTDFLTADEVGFFISVSSTTASGLTLLSWAQA